MNLKIVFLWIVPAIRVLRVERDKDTPTQDKFGHEESSYRVVFLAQEVFRYTNLQKPSRAVDSECVNRCERLFFPSVQRSTVSL